MTDLYTLWSQRLYIAKDGTTTTQEDERAIVVDLDGYPFNGPDYPMTKEEYLSWCSENGYRIEQGDTADGVVPVAGTRSESIVLPSQRLGVAHIV